MDQDRSSSKLGTNRFQFSPHLQICRILNGMWQVSGAHGPVDPDRAVDSMFAYVDSGFTTWDLADHYGPAEDFIGDFRRRLALQRGAGALGNVQSFTKWVPPRVPWPENGSNKTSISLYAAWAWIPLICSNSTGGTTVTSVS